jgi:uncharacterized protein YdaT
MSKLRLKKFAVNFYNNLLKEEKKMIVEAYREKEAVDIATLQIDTKYNDWSEDFADYFTIKKVELVKV